MTETIQDKIIQGDALEQLSKLPSDFVDCVFTSPPYWGLRDYGIEGQIGLEDHPQKYIEKLVGVFRELRRVLKPSGSFFLNLGDTYYGSGTGRAERDLGTSQKQLSNKGFFACDHAKDFIPHHKINSWMQPKQKMLIPERTAMALQEDGWILRNSIIWHKNNHMPEPVADRFTRSYETIFFFTKSPKYYFNLDSVRQQSTTTPWTTKPGKYKVNNPRTHYTQRVKENIAFFEKKGSGGNFAYGGLDSPDGKHLNAKGKNPGDVWVVNTEMSEVKAHFAMFPTKLVRRGLLCGCPKEGLVLDPFAGAGTTLYVARRMALHYIRIELNPKYIEIAAKRLSKIPLRLDHLLACNNLAENK